MNRGYLSDPPCRFTPAAGFLIVNYFTLFLKFLLALPNSLRILVAGERRTMSKKVKRPNQTSMLLDDDTKKRLDAYCAKRGLKKMHVVNQAVKQYLQMQEG